MGTDYNKYLSASFTEQMRMMFDSIKEQQEKLSPKNYLTASPMDQFRIMINSLEEEKHKIDSGYYLTAPLTEKFAFMVRQIQAEVKRETELKISEIEFHLEWLDETKKYVILLLDLIDKDQPNIGNLKEVNDLLDKLIFLLKEKKKKHEDLDQFKK